MLTVGVQTWGTDVPALERYWKTADDLGYARITYGDGLGDWTHDGWTMLGALAVLTRRATARCADGWEASYLSPADFTMRWQRLSMLLRAEGRTVDSFPRAVEVDAIVTEADAPLSPLIDRFCAARGIERGHPLLGTVLAGDGAAIAERMAGYEAAGATDLMLGFADFPSTGMLEAFAATVLHGRPPAS